MEKVLRIWSQKDKSQLELMEEGMKMGIPPLAYLFRQLNGRWPSEKEHFDFMMSGMFIDDGRFPITNKRKFEKIRKKFGEFVKNEKKGTKAYTNEFHGGR